MSSFNKSNIVAIQMDPIKNLNFITDSTLIIALELQARGYKIFSYQPVDLSYQNHQVLAQGNFVKLFDNEKYYYELQEAKILNLEEAEIVLIRQNPPFNMDYITATYLLDKLHNKTLVLNDPQELRNHSEKFMIYSFPDHINESIVSSNIKQLETFFLNFKDVILKPLYDFGGSHIERIKNHTEFNNVVSPYLQKHKTIIMQKFLPNVANGDKRVLMVDGKITGAILRVPQQGKVTANLATGGVAHKTTLNAKEVKACQDVGEFLHAKNLFLAGIDLLDGYLLEINVTSPTCFKTYRDLYDDKIEKTIVDVMVQKAKAYY